LIGFVWKFRAPFLAACCAPLLLSGCGSSKEPNYFPVTLGSSWTYAGNSGKLPFEMAAAVTSSKKLKDQTVAVVQWSDKGQPFKDETYEVTAAKVTHSRSGAYSANRIEPPIPVLELPLRVGKKWSWQGKVIVPGQSVTTGNAESEVVAREKVTVPAGTFDAFRIRTTLWTMMGKKKVAAPSTVWFAPGGGLVKQNSEGNLATGEAPVESALTKYTIR
jgi:hypothetical protein